MKVSFFSIITMITLAFCTTLFSPAVSLADANPAVTPPVANNLTDDGSSGITNVLCRIIGVAQGNTGKTIAILVVISIAIGLFLGKITWGVAIAVSVGMGVLFGAGPMVFAISGNASDFKTVCPANN
jgi:type IV secretory pathway VirB2 component (pilin)